METIVWNYIQSNITVMSYGPGKDHYYASGVTLTLEIWPRDMAMTHP